MYCKYCGKEINDDADVCIHCGRRTDRYNQANFNVRSYEVEEPKTGIGVLLGLCFGIIGLIIGLLLYPSGSLMRSTFLKGWVGIVVIRIAAGIVIFLLVIFFSFCR